MFQAPAEAEFQPVSGLQLFENKQRAAVGVGLGHESFLAQRRELVAVDLSADYPVQRPERQVTCFDPGFVTLVLEGGSHFATLDLAVLVVGVPGVQFQRTERTLQVTYFRGEGVMILLHADAYVLLGRRAVIGVVSAVGQPRVTVIPGVRTAHGAAILTPATVTQVALFIIVVTLRCVTAAGLARDFQVVELAGVGIQVQGESAVARFQFAGTAAGGRGAAITQFTGAMNPVDGFGRDAIVEGIDHAADGIAAI